MACLNVPASYWDLHADTLNGAGRQSTEFCLRWSPPASAAFGTAVCACCSGGVTCIAYASGRVIALAGDWEAPLWVWDEGGRCDLLCAHVTLFRFSSHPYRVTCARMFGGCVVWGLGDGGVCVGCLATGECVRWVFVQCEACDVSSWICVVFDTAFGVLNCSSVSQVFLPESWSSSRP